MAKFSLRFKNFIVIPDQAKLSKNSETFSRQKMLVLSLKFDVKPN